MGTEGAGPYGPFKGLRLLLSEVGAMQGSKQRGRCPQSGVHRGPLVIKLQETQNAVDFILPSTVGPSLPFLHPTFHSSSGLVTPPCTCCPVGHGLGPHSPTQMNHNAFLHAHISLSISSLQFIIDQQVIHRMLPKGPPTASPERTSASIPNALPSPHPKLQLRRCFCEEAPKGIQPVPTPSPVHTRPWLPSSTSCHSPPGAHPGHRTEEQARGTGESKPLDNPQPMTDGS